MHRTDLATSKKVAIKEITEEESAEIVWNALETDPALAFEVFRQLPADHPEKIKLINHYAMSLADGDPEAAMVWAASLDTEREIAAANGKIAVVIAESDPHHAATLLSDFGIEGHECDVAIAQVIQRWAVQSPPDAAAWAASFPAGAARESGLGIIISHWAKTDSAAAFAWLRALGDKAVRMDALLAMEKVLLQQPEDVQKAWLQATDSETCGELEAQREAAMREIGDNLLPALSLTKNSATSHQLTGEGSQ